MMTTTIISSINVKPFCVLVMMMTPPESGTAGTNRPAGSRRATDGYAGQPTCHTQQIFTFHPQVRAAP